MSELVKVSTALDDKREKAFNVYLELQQRRQQAVLNYLETGRLLKLIKEEHLYQYLGDGGYDSFLDFINNPEIGISRGYIYQYIKIYELYVERIGLTADEVMQVHINRLIKMIPILKEKPIEEAKSEILQMGSLTHTDYLQQITEKGYEPEKPNLWLDKATGKYVLEFREFNMLRIFNKDKKETIYESTENDLPVD